MRSLDDSRPAASLYDSVSRVLIQFSRTLSNLKVDPEGESPIPASAFLDRIADLRDRCADLVAAATAAGHVVPGRDLVQSFDQTLDTLSTLVAGTGEAESDVRATMDRCRAQVTELLAKLGRVRDALADATPAIPGSDEGSRLVAPVRLRLALAHDLRWLDCAHPDRTLVPKGAPLPHSEILVDRRPGRDRTFRFACGPVQGSLAGEIRLRHAQILVALHVDWLGFLTLEAAPTDDPDRKPAFAGPVALPIDFQVRI